MRKFQLQQKAIHLRKQGKTYSEILKEIPVAKSTLSEWFRDVGLSVVQKQKITQKKKLAQLKGSQARHADRIKRQSDLMCKACEEVKHISKRELWLIGTALYWAEGSKEKEERPGSRASFSNSDPRMLALFLKWLTECVQVPVEDIGADLYIHESHRNNVEAIYEKWSTLLGVPRSFFKYTYFKKNKIQTKRKNTGVLYIGLLRVNIRASSDLNRKIAGWIKGITTHCGVV